MRMLIKDVWRLFCYYPLRSILSLLALVIGMSTLTILMVIDNSITKHSEETLDRQGSRLGLSIAKSELHNIYVESWVSAFKPAFSLLPYYSVPANVWFNNNKLPAEVVAVKPEFFTAIHWPLLQGRYLHTLDTNNKVIVVGSEIAKSAVKGIDRLSIDGEYFTIIGVLDKVDFDPVLNFDPNFSIFIELSFIQYFVHHPVAQDFIVFVQNLPLMQAENTLKQKINTLLPQATVFIKNPVVLQKALYHHIDLTLKTLKIISMITLVLGFISTLNLFLILLQERKPEMGLRLALGATTHDLGWQFFKETLLMCVLGGSLGVILGELAAIIIVYNLELHYYWQWATAIMGLVISGCVGILVGIVPALVAAKQSPVKLL